MAGPVERRYCEVRLEPGEGSRVLSGTVLRYGDVAPSIGGVFSESVKRGGMKFGDVTLNVQHDRGRLVSRTGAGMELSDTTTALTMRAELPPTRVAEDALEAVRAGLLRGLSVEMQVDRDEWTQQQGSLPLRIIHRARLVGLALVDTPAYPASTLARALVDARMPVGVMRGGRRLWR